MVIETAVVGPLRLHIFGGLSKGAPPCGDLPLEKFQLPAAPLHPITAAIPFDGSALSQGEADLTEAEGLRKGDNFALALVYPDTQGLEAAHYLAGQLLQLLDVREGDIIIVHVVTSHMDPGLALYPVVHAAGQGHHLLL